MSNYYVIADVAGQYEALMRLVSKFEPDSKLYFLGDLSDRGPKTKQVIEFCMTNPDVKVCLSNHEHMMADWITNGGFYDDGVWLENGGEATVESYFPDYSGYHDCFHIRQSFPKDHLTFIQNLEPVYQIELDNKKFILTHAPIFNADLETSLARAKLKDFKGFNYEYEYGVLWNRNQPQRIPGYVQLFGHNSYWGVKYFNTDDEPWAICLDDSQRNVLTALHLNTMTVIQEPYESR